MKGVHSTETDPVAVMGPWIIGYRKCHPLKGYIIFFQKGKSRLKKNKKNIFSSPIFPRWCRCLHIERNAYSVTSQGFHVSRRDQEDQPDQVSFRMVGGIGEVSNAWLFFFLNKVCPFYFLRAPFLLFMPQWSESLQLLGAKTVIFAKYLG